MTRRSRSTKAAANNTNNPSSEIPKGATSRWPNTAVIASVAVGAAAPRLVQLGFEQLGVDAAAAASFALGLRENVDDLEAFPVLRRETIDLIKPEHVTPGLLRPYEFDALHVGVFKLRSGDRQSFRDADAERDEANMCASVTALDAPGEALDLVADTERLQISAALAAELKLVGDVELTVALARHRVRLGFVVRHDHLNHIATVDAARHALATGVGERKRVHRQPLPPVRVVASYGFDHAYFAEQPRGRGHGSPAQ